MSMVAAGGAAGAADPPAEQAFVDALNQIRAAEGLPPLEVDTELTIAARSWTDAMVADADGGAGRGALAHASDLSVGVTVYWIKLGENVGYGPSVEVLVDAFVDSPTHYRNIIDPDFESIGVGVSYDAEGTMWTTHRFMVADGDAAPAPEVLAFTEDDEAPTDDTVDTTPEPTAADAETTPVVDTVDPTEGLSESAKRTIEVYAGIGDELTGLGL